MAAVLNNAFLLAVARLLNQLPTLDELLRSLDRDEGLPDGSRYL